MSSVIDSANMKKPKRQPIIHDIAGSTDQIRQGRGSGGGHHGTEPLWYRPIMVQKSYLAICIELYILTHIEKL